MPDFSAGTVHVQVIPSLDGWKKAFDKQLKQQLGNTKVDVDVQARFNTFQLRQQLLAISRNVRIYIDVDDRVAKGKLRVLQTQLNRIRRNLSVNIHVNIRGAAGAMAALAALGAAINRNTNQTVTVQANDNGSIDLLSSRLQRLVALFVASSGAIGGAAAGLLALGAAATAGAAGLGAVIAGGAQIAVAMKAQSAASRQAGQSALQEASQRISAANGVLNAQDAVRDAIQNVATAQRTASSSIRTALQNQQQAEERLVDAQESALRAQLALTDARRDAQRSLEDLQNDVIGNALDQRQAVLDLQDAQERLAEVQADPGATERQRVEAQLNFEQAQQNLTEIGVAYRRSQEDASAAAAAGVEGSDQVVDAQRNIVGAQRAVLEAQRANEEAALRLDESRISGAEQVANAQQQVIRAQRQLESAQAASTVQTERQGEAQAKFSESLERLTPASINLIRYLRSQSGEWTLLSQAAQGFAPGLQRSLEKLSPHFDSLNTNVGIVSTAMGDFMSVIADGLISSEPFFDIIASASTELLPRFGETVNEAAGAVFGLAVDMLPLADNAFDAVDALSRLVEAWTPFIVQASGPLLESLEGIINKLDFLGPLLVAIAEPAGDLTEALVGGLREAFTELTPALGPLLDSLIDLVETVAPLIGVTGALAAVAAEVLKPAIDGAAIVLQPFVDLLGFFADVIRDLPTELVAVVAGLIALRFVAGPIQGLFGTIGTALGLAAINAGNFTQRITGSTTAAGKFASAGTRIANGLTNMGKAIPILGIALIGLGEAIAAEAEEERKAQEQVEKYGAALLRGGKSADAARLAVENLRGQAQKLALIGEDDAARQWSERADQIEASAKKQAAAMSELELAQGRVRQAQLDYDYAVRTFGPTSQEAVIRYVALQDETSKLRIVQDEAADATKTHTERLQDQNDLILGMTDSRIAHQRAGLRLRDAESRLNEVMKDGEATADDILEAQLDLSSAQSHYVATAGAAAKATGEATGVQDLAAATIKGTNDALIELAKTQGERLPPSILSMIAQIGEADAKFYGLTTRVDETGNTIITLPGAPGQPPVSITFTDNVPAIRSDIQVLADDLTKLTMVERHVKILLDYTPGANTSPGESGPMIQLPGINTGRARGGPIPGTGNRDTVPIMATPGEFMFSRPAVDNIGMANLAAFHAAAVQGFARGGPVGVQRLASGGPVAASTAPTGAPIELGWLAQFVALFEAMTSASGPLTAALNESVQPALQSTMGASAQLAQMSAANWQNMATAVSISTGAMGGYMAVLRAGMAQVVAATTQTATTFQQQWDRMRAAAADPVRWVLTFPFNAGIIAAWNRLDADFALGKPIAPVAIPFAVGGRVPGVGLRDTVDGKLTPGEYVFSLPAIKNMGGLGAVHRLHEAARAGMIGPDARLGGKPGDAALRLRLMRTIPFDGLGFAYGGVQPHVAFAGSEIERVFGALPGGIGGVGARPNASDHPFGLALDFMTMNNMGLGDQIATYLQTHAARLAVKYLIWRQQFNDGSGWSAMADRGSITANHFDHVHASFLAAGLAGAAFGGKGFFDPAALVEGYFADTYRMLDQAGGLFGGVTAGQAGAIARQAADAVREAGINALWSPAAAGAAAGSPEVVAAVRAVAATFGWGDGAQWDALSWLIAHESSWDPSAANPSSSARGLFQKLTSIHGPVEPTPTGQAQWGLSYIRDRYGDPLRARAFWRANNWYDDGGYLPPGLSLSYNGTGRPEPVLTPAQWSAMATPAGGAFTGSLYLDSGQFLGTVRGEINRANEFTGRAIARRTR